MISVFDHTIPSSFIGLIVFGATYCLYYYYRHRNIPPGPIGLPLVGYSPFLQQNAQDVFLKLKKKYGNIMSMYMGPHLTVILNDYEAIKAAYMGQADVFLGRADTFVLRTTSATDGDIHGLLLLEGDMWKTTRKFMLQTFRDLGMGKAKIQERILEEAEYLADIFSSYQGQAFPPFPTLVASTGNVMCTLCFGKRFDHHDPAYRKILEDGEANTRLVGQAGPMEAYPVLRFFPCQMKTVWREICERVNRRYTFLRAMIAEHRKTYVETETRDYIDAFLHQQNREAAISEIQPAFRDVELIQNIRVFMGAGTDTSAVTLEWALLFMLHYPDVQEKIHQEMDLNIGRDQIISVDERAKLPYLGAVIREVQRLGNVAALGVLRATLEETTLLGYRIPKRCSIIPNFKAVNTDPKLWPNPLAFIPERFLDKEGKIYEPPHFMPFSLGKRACVGEALARMEIFLFFAHIMQRFVLRPAKDFPIPPLDQYTTALSCRPSFYHLEAIPRHGK